MQPKLGNIPTKPSSVTSHNNPIHYYPRGYSHKARHRSTVLRRLASQTRAVVHFRTTRLRTRPFESRRATRQNIHHPNHCLSYLQHRNPNNGCRHRGCMILRQEIDRGVSNFANFAKGCLGLNSRLCRVDTPRLSFAHAPSGAFAPNPFLPAVPHDAPDWSMSPAAHAGISNRLHACG
jgi:hypothetical protein